MPARSLTDTNSVHLDFARILRGTTSQNVARIARLSGTDTVDLWRPQNVPRITMSISPAQGFATDTGNVRITYSIDPGDLTVRSREAHVSVDGAAAVAIPITVALTGVLEVPRPNGDATYTITADSDAGHGAAHANYHLRVPLSGLSITHEFIAQRGFQQAVQVAPRVHVAWTGSDITAASLTVGAGYGSQGVANLIGYRHTQRTGNSWTSYRDMVIPRDDNANVNVPVTLSVTGIDASGMATTLTASDTILVRHRGA